MITEEMRQMCLVESEGKSMGTLHSEYGEMFTDTKTILTGLEFFPNEIWEHGKTFIDPQCGNGQLIIPVAIIKKELGHDNILDTIFGIDIVEKNVLECRERLLAVCGINKKNKQIVEKNIICKDILK